MDVDFLKSLKRITEKNLGELSKKSDMTAAETKSAKDAMELLEYLECKIEECKMEEREKEYSQYSGRDVDRRPYREYQITSYRGPHGRLSFDSMRNDRYSSAMRSGRTRSYNGSSDSYDSIMRYGDPYNIGYSGHSIGDRAVALMEEMYDDAKSEYERNQVSKFIAMIRSVAQME